MKIYNIIIDNDGCMEMPLDGSFINRKTAIENAVIHAWDYLEYLSKRTEEPIETTKEAILAQLEKENYWMEEFGDWCIEIHETILVTT